MAQNILVIGLDYGTTYTGVSYCEVSKMENIEPRIQVVQDWPSTNTLIGTKEKVPSEVAYLPDGIRWGSTIPSHIQRHMWTKLKLENLRTGEAEKIHKELLSSAYGGVGGVKRPVDIIADFLAKVKEQLIMNLDKQYGPKLWRTLPITLVVTVPAVWSDAAKALTMQAVSQAGFNKTGLKGLQRTVTTTEPEAAAIYTIRSLRGSVKNATLTVGDCFIVCDMGGGTVDLISYRVAGIEPTVVEEATEGNGDQCGGSFVDRGFLKWLERKLGTKEFADVAGCSADEVSRTSLPPKLGKMMQDFSLNAKSGFSGAQDCYLRLPASVKVEDDEAKGFLDGEIILTSTDIKEMFEFPLRRTKELIEEQLQLAAQKDKAKIKYIFMVGGFAESQYMYNQIKALAESHGEIQVVKPDYAWSAIVRGAAAKGLEDEDVGPVKSRKCRRHYGTGYSSPFNPRKHSENEACIDPYTGLKKAGDQSFWIVKKGDDLIASKPYHGKTDMYRKFWADEERVAHVRLLAADTDKAPRLSTDKNVNWVTSLVIDLSPVPEREFRKQRSPTGRVYYELNYDLEISIQSSLEFSFSVNGVRYGSVTAEYT